LIPDILIIRIIRIQSLFASYYMDKQTQKELLEIVRHNYDEIAKDFDETRKKALWPEMVKLAGEVKDGDKVLDVGCGNGRLLEALADKNILYTGIDQSEKLLAAAKKNYPGRTFSTGNLLELTKLPELNFDYVFCLAVLHHLPGQDLRLAALRQLKNKIKDDGRIIITIWNLWAQPKYRKLIFKFALLKMIKKNRLDFGDIIFNWQDNLGGRVSKRYYHAFTGRELKRIVRRAGLRTKKIYQDDYNYYLVLRK
jgi:2-polyprenyl-3-methyl-5-hydroxy-6-metoxy-1,4-benzoquinol methylase